MPLDTWELRRKALEEHRAAKQASYASFEESFGRSDSDYGMDGYAIADFIDWLRDAYKHWPLETLTYIIAVAMDDREYLKKLHRNSYEDEG